MARIKRAQIRHTRKTRIMRRAKGFHLARSKTFRQAHQAVMKAESYAFRGRKEKKRQFRSLWIVRINAALMPHGLSYSRFMHGLKRAGVLLDRKALANLALHDPDAFSVVVGHARSALG